MNIAVVHLQAGRWTEMRECLEQARGMARRMGFDRRWEEATSQFSTACLLAGNFGEARLLNNELLGASERADPQSRCWAVVRQAELCLLTGDIGGAIEAAQEGVRFCEQGLGRAEWIYALGPLALARLHSGDVLGARQTADACAAWIRRGSIPIFYNVFSHGALAEVYLSLWQDERDPSAKNSLARGARYATEQLSELAGAMAIAVPRARLIRGLTLLNLDRRRERALNSFRESLRHATALAMPYDEALARVALADHGPPSEQALHLAEAERILRQLGATADLVRLARIRALSAAVLPA
jgi:hypothetical protein